MVIGHAHHGRARRKQALSQWTQRPVKRLLRNCEISGRTSASSLRPPCEWDASRCGRGVSRARARGRQQPLAKTIVSSHRLFGLHRPVLLVGARLAVQLQRADRCGPVRHRSSRRSRRRAPQRQHRRRGRWRASTRAPTTGRGAFLPSPTFGTHHASQP